MDFLIHGSLKPKTVEKVTVDAFFMWLQARTIRTNSMLFLSILKLEP